MSDAGPSRSGSSSDFGPLYEVLPKGKHLATVVWLHALGDNGSSWRVYLEDYNQNIKWVLPTAPLRNLTIFGGSRATAWFNMKDHCGEAFLDEDGLLSSLKYLESLLAKEPEDIKLVVGGFSMGAATALYFAIYFARREFKKNLNLKAVIGYSGWLSDTKIPEMVEEMDALLPILLVHRKDDSIVEQFLIEESHRKLNSFGFKKVKFIETESKECSSLRLHHPETIIMQKAEEWMRETLGLKSSQDHSQRDPIPREGSGPPKPPLPPAVPFVPIVHPIKVSASAEPSPSSLQLKSSVHGIFHTSAGPGKPSFVKVGDRVEKGQPLGTISPIKTTTIEAGQSGIILKVLVKDGKYVTADTPLFIIEPS